MCGPRGERHGQKDHDGNGGIDARCGRTAMCLLGGRRVGVAAERSTLRLRHSHRAPTRFDISVPRTSSEVRGPEYVSASGTQRSSERQMPRGLVRLCARRPCTVAGAPAATHDYPAMPMCGDGTARPCRPRVQKAGSTHGATCAGGADRARVRESDLPREGGCCVRAGDVSRHPVPGVRPRRLARCPAPFRCPLLLPGLQKQGLSRASQA